MLHREANVTKPSALVDALLLDVLRACPVRPVTWSFLIQAPKFNRRGNRKGSDELVSASGFESRDLARQHAEAAQAQLRSNGETRQIEIEVMTDHLLGLFREYAA